MQIAFIYKARRSRSLPAQWNSCVSGGESCHQAQEFERRHGVRPNVLYLNVTHYTVLRDDCPDLFRPGSRPSLGVHIVIKSDRDQLHPEVAWYPPRVSRLAS